MKSQHVAILGSGISSLTSAALLSKKGIRVTVFEQHTKPGGYMHCFQRFGKRFDTGAHYVGSILPGQTFHQLLSYLGVFNDELFCELDRDGFDELHFPDFSVAIPVGYAEVIRRLSEQFPAEKAGISAYFHLLRTTATLFPTHGFHFEENHLAEINKYTETTLASVVEAHVQDPKLRAVLYSYCTLHGVHPKHVAFALHAVMSDSLYQGAAGFKKGGDAVVNRYVDVILKNGGSVRTRTEVTRIETLNGVAVAVHTDQGERIGCDTIISGIHPRAAFKLVDHPEIFSPAFRSRITNVRETPAIFGIYGVQAHVTNVNPLRNYHFFNSYNPDEIFQGPFPKNPVAAFLCPSERTLSPGSPFTFSAHAVGPMEWFGDWNDSKFGKRPPEYHDQKNVYAEKVIQLMHGMHKGLNQPVDKMVTSTALSHLHYNGSHEGSSYGIYHSIQNTGARALGPRTRIPNLLLTGQNALFPGILASALSGVITAGHILGIKPILREIRAETET